MDKRSVTLTKTCSTCGQQKPLSAFLQVGGPHGTIYGNICASCRKTAQEKEAAPEAEDSSKSKTGAVIDAKTKVQLEFDKRKERQRLKELHLEEDRKDTEEKIVTTEKKEQASKTEKKHREEKRSFLDSSTRRTVTPQQVFGGDAHIAKEGKIDLKVSQTDFAVSGKAKYQSAEWHTFLNRLGLDAPRAAAQRLSSQSKSPEKTPPAAAKEKRESLVKNLKTWADAQQKSEPSENPSEDFVNKTWGPKRS